MLSPYREGHDGREYKAASDTDDLFPQPDPSAHWRTVKNDEERVSTFDSLTGKATVSQEVVDVCCRRAGEALGSDSCKGRR